VIVAGILGGRIGYVIAHPGQFAAQPLDVVKIRQGGLVFYGGMAGAVAAACVFARVRKLPLWDLADTFAPAIPVGHALGRVGCFLNGCCFGRETEVPWAVFIQDAHRHPSQLYLVAGNLVVAGLVILVDRRSRRDEPPRLLPGMLFWVYVGLYGVMRFAVEFSRGDYTFYLPGNLTVAQVISVALIGIAIAFVAGLARGRKQGGTG